MLKGSSARRVQGWSRMKAKAKFHEGFGICYVANRENMHEQERKRAIRMDELFLFFSHLIQHSAKHIIQGQIFEI
jgi:hypothetical protein